MTVRQLNRRLLEVTHLAQQLAARLQDTTAPEDSTHHDRSRTWCDTREDYAFAGHCRSALAPTERAARRRDLIPPHPNPNPQPPNHKLTMKHQRSNGLCFRHCAACAAKQAKATLKLQQLAMSAYPTDYPTEDLTARAVDHGALDGDTLAQFIWNEVGDAEGSVEDAARMINTSVEELSAVARKLMDHCPAVSV